jgi:hypothetical protein
MMVIKWYWPTGESNGIPCEWVVEYNGEILFLYLCAE